MDPIKFITDNWQFIKSNPVPFMSWSFLSFGVAWFIFTLIHKERLAILQERLSSKDDQIKYYKELSDAKQTTQKPKTENVIPSPGASSIKDDIIREIKFLEQNTGKALSVQLFDRLQVKYTFLVILSEMLLMNKNNELKWTEAPNPPDALSEIRIVVQRTT